jgi:hypothetical protein
VLPVLPVLLLRVVDTLLVGGGRLGGWLIS